MRAVLDPNVLIAAILSREGAPARVLAAWLAGSFELVVSEKLLGELERALAYPKLRARIAAADAAAFVELLRVAAIVAEDPSEVPARCADPDDDYLIALAECSASYLVSGDRHLRDLAETFPVRAAPAFLALIEAP